MPNPPLAFLIVLMSTTCAVQAGNQASPEKQVQDLVNSLPAESNLKNLLLQGARGDGARYPWMDEMRKQGIRRVVVWVDIRFDSKGRPKRATINHLSYFEQYESEGQISDPRRLEAIRACNLQDDLGKLAIEKAQRGRWVDVPHPKPRPFWGGTQVEFFDNEWIPVPKAPLYYTRSSGQQSK